MLEWYRAFADLEHLIDDLRGILKALAPLSPTPDYFARPLEVISCTELFQRELNLTLVDHENRDPLRQYLQSRVISFDESDDWDTLYFLIFLNFIEGNLGKNQPTIVVN